MQRFFHTSYNIYTKFPLKRSCIISHSYSCLLQGNLPFCLWHLCLELGKIIYTVLKQHSYLRYSSDEHDKIFDQSSLIDFSNYARHRSPLMLHSRNDPPMKET